MPEEPLGWPQAGAYRNAVGLLLLGLSFAQYAIEFSGIDLLIDAVGWLLVFNGLRPLERPGGGVGPRAWLCLALVGVSALQVLARQEALVFGVLLARVVLEVAFFLLLIGLFAKKLPVLGCPRAKIPFVLVFSFNALAAVLEVVAALGLGVGWLDMMAEAAVFAAGILLMAVLLWLLFSLQKKMQ